MSDTPQGPGWWQASDGRYYPPEQHPTAPATPSPEPWPAPTTPSSESWQAPTGPPPGPWQAPTGPPPGAWQAPGLPPPVPPANPRGKRNLVIGIVLAVAVLIGIVAIIGSRSGGGSGDTAASSAPVAAATGQTITTDSGSASLTLPDGWRGASVENGTAGVGQQLFPDDAEVASRVETNLAVLPRAIVLFGLDPSSVESGFTSNVNVLPDPTAPPNLDLAQLGAAELQGVERVNASGQVRDKGIVDLGPVKAYSFVYDLGQASIVAFVIKDAGKVWVLSYSFAAGRDDVELARASAATFDAK